MSLLDIIAEVLGTTIAPPGFISRIIMMVLTGAAGTCCSVFAYAAISQFNTAGFVVGPFLIVLAGLCFWIFWRQVRSLKRS